MKSKSIVIWITFLFLAQACTPLNTGVPTVSTATKPQADVRAPVVEPTLPNVQVEITPQVSTTVMASSAVPLPLPLITETPSASGNTFPEDGVTLQDNGRIFTMKAGDSFLLNLGTEVYDWSVSIDNENVLHPKTGVMVIQGAQGIYDALASGTAILTAAGDPLCRRTKPPCMMPSILFKITVLVE